MAKKLYVGVRNFTPRALPSGYTQVEYIQSSGTQYINTGVNPNQNTRIEIDFEMVGSVSNPTPFGAWTANFTDAFIFVGGSTGLFYGTQRTTFAVDISGRKTINANKNVWAVNGSVVHTFEQTTFTTAQSMLLFAYSNAGTATSLTPMKLYSCQIYDDGTLVRDYVPCKEPNGNVGLYDLVNSTFYANAGTGTFTEGEISSSVARKGKKMYFSPDGLARKVKKAYIGVGGVARPFWSGGELAYYGTITALSVKLHYHSATTVGNHALFGAGYYGATAQKTVNAYNESLTRSTPTSLSAGENRSSYSAATTVGDYAIFAGGSMEEVANAYNSSLTRSIPTALSTMMLNHGATTVGNHALFGGGGTSFGSGNTDAVNAYDESLTRSIPTALSVARGWLQATTVGNHALFGGGYDWSSRYANVDAYDESLTRSIPTALSVARRWCGATTVGNHALFAGGYTTRGSKVVDAYDTSLTRTTPTILSAEMYAMGATTVEDFAIFGGSAGSGPKSTVNAYDASLTRTIPTSLSSARGELAAATIGNFVLFAGGYDNAGNTYDTVDVFVAA